MSEPPIITLTSDFGSGPHAAVMKGVILGICPRAQLVDVSHAVPPQDVAAGAAVLEEAWPAFPAGTVHLAVVDPGVGTDRRPLALAAGGHFFVGPDNGLFTPALAADPAARVHEITNRTLMRRPVSATFHGRDVFAPVAARLAVGLRLEEVGPAAESPVLLERAAPREEGGALLGRVSAVDPFGNLVCDLERARVEVFLAGRPAVVEAAGLVFPGIRATYGEAPPGELLALYNSAGRLELAVNRGDLRRNLGLSPERARGLKVAVRPAGGR